MASIARTITQFGSRKTIDLLFSKARRVVKHPGLHILIAPKENTVSRILIVISRKVGNAPARNTLRRQVKAIFYQERFFEGPYDVIVIAKPGGTPLSFTTLKELLSFSLRKPSPRV